MNHRSLLVVAIIFLAPFTACRPALTSPVLVLPAAERVSHFPYTDTDFQKLLHEQGAVFDSLLKQNDQWKISIIYTQIDRDKNNHPHFRHFLYNLDPYRYFYPASTIKLPLAVLSLEKINQLNIPGFDRESFMLSHPEPWQKNLVSKSIEGAEKSSIANHIRKIFLASDNEASNRLYEFLGQEYIHRSLKEKGYDHARILHRLSVSLSEDQNRTTNAISIYDSSSNLVYHQPRAISHMTYPAEKILLGSGFIQSGVLVQEPFNFSHKNLFTLSELHTMLMAVMFPSAFPEKQRFDLKTGDYKFLYRYMSMLPRESEFSKYRDKLPDAYVKFLLYGGDGAITDSSIRIFNKVGDAYGFLTDVAYIADFENKVEFLLSANIYCNSDGIFNDDQYDYNRVGFPFLKNLGRTIYNHELKRKKKRMPDLSDFKLN